MPDFYGIWYICPCTTNKATDTIKFNKPVVPASNGKAAIVSAKIASMIVMLLNALRRVSKVFCLF